MADPAWPGAEARRLIGERIARLDGPAKVTGTATYTYDVGLPGMLHARIVRCPHARARVRRIDVSAAESMPGIKAVHVAKKVGDEIQWALDEVVYVAAATEQQAADAVRAVRVDYEVLAHDVRDDDPDHAPGAKPSGEESTGDPAGALAKAEARISGRYGLPRVAHVCLEAHGQVVQWTDPQSLRVWASTQAVSSIGGQMAEALDLPASGVRVTCEHMGGGFGSKFSPDTWGIACAELARKAKAPVKLMLDRDAEIAVAGDRPSTWAEVELGGDRDGRLTAWSSRSWGSGGTSGTGSPPLPYVLEIPNRSHRHVSIPTHTAGARAWRAPNHPQACFVTMAAVEDFAAALGKDPLEIVVKNLELSGPREATYREQLRIGAELMDWKAKWHPRGASGAGPVKRGVGLSLHTWGGRGHRSACDVTVYPDGVVEAKLGSQDLGTGTRTVIGIVLAETFGLPVDAVRVMIGDSTFPPSGASGGSTTVGGVSASTRRGAEKALALLLEKLAPGFAVAPEALEAVGGSVRVKGRPDTAIPWKQATARLGPTPVTGRLLNPNMEFYKIPGIGDVGELVVHLMTGPEHDGRGVIGLGEPPVISPGAAIANAVANAVGVRVPELPLTPDRVLAALAGARKEASS